MSVVLYSLSSIFLCLISFYPSSTQWGKQMQRSIVTKAVKGLGGWSERNISEMSSKVGTIVISILCLSVQPFKSFGVSLLSICCVPELCSGSWNAVVSESDKAPYSIRAHMMKIRGSRGRGNSLRKKVMIYFWIYCLPGILNKNA